ncbi:Hypothetical protein CINCED_3A022311 [Cinara cedri]|uniref:Uncharacterized protein n=1 Tax=Cinara cedri TaxID=506608 RepID=A0A5E4M5C6_9HEMI|nr:Hypothetical protein CINCED_3A022311 [Cinara cedri]
MKAEKAKIEAFEVWCWRRVLKISWTEKIKNDEIFRRMNTQKSIWNTLGLRRKAWIGHVIRNSPWITTIIEGKNRRKTWKRKAQNSISEAGDGRYRNKNILGDERIISDRDKWRETPLII